MGELRQSFLAFESDEEQKCEIFSLYGTYIYVWVLGACRCCPRNRADAKKKEVSILHFSIVQNKTLLPHLQNQRISILHAERFDPDTHTDPEYVQFKVPRFSHITLVEG